MTTGDLILTWVQLQLYAKFTIKIYVTYVKYEILNPIGFQMSAYLSTNSKMRLWPLVTLFSTQGHPYTYEINNNLLNNNPVNFCDDTIRNNQKQFLVKFWNFRGGELKILKSGRTQNLISKGNTRKEYSYQIWSKSKTWFSSYRSATEK